MSNSSALTGQNRAEGSANYPLAAAAHEDAFKTAHPVGGHYNAGPYHPALEQLVTSSIFYDLSMRGMERLQPETMNMLDIEVSPENISNVIGNRRETLARLKNDYPSCEIRVNENITLQPDHLLVSVSDKSFLLKKEELLSNM